MNPTVEILSRARRKGKLSHAYLAPVRPGVELEKYGLTLAKEIICEGEDQGCRQRVLRGVHPDVRRLEVEEGKSEISIDAVKDLIASVDYSPVSARRKVHLIQKGEDMSQEAANSILKVLESPPGFTVFLILTLRPEMVISTILSRCQRLPLGGLSKGGWRESLSAEGFDEEEVQYLMELGNERGDLIKDLSHRYKDQELLTSRERAREEYGPLGPIRLSEKLTAEEGIDPLKEHELIRALFFSSLSAELFAALECAKNLSQLDREKLNFVLEKGLLLCRERLVEETGAEAGVPVEAVKEILQALEDLESNANPQLVLESTFLKLRESRNMKKGAIER